MSLMGLFGSKKKIEFDARSGLNVDDLGNFSFVHNFKVHWKRSGLQMLANKLDISVISESSALPSYVDVAKEFNARMLNSVMHTDTRGRFSLPSYHITNIEYKESLAMRKFSA